MAWTTPRTWVDSEFVDAALMNLHVRDNMDYLKNPPTDAYQLNEASDYTTSSTSFVDVDSSDLSLEITTSGGDVLVVVSVTVAHSSNTGRIYFDLTQNGSRIGGDDGLFVFETFTSAAGQGMNVSFAVQLSGLAAATYEFRLQWKTSAATATLFAGAGTSNYDLHGQMWAREVT